MIVRRFLLWIRTAPVGSRAEAVSALARAYLYSELSPQDHAEAETALTAMLDDPSPLVRRALAESLANAADAPRHLVSALANDQSDIAALVLSRSPVLTQADLVDAAALGDEVVQTAIAGRPRVPVPVAAALAEIASPPPLVALLDNPGAEIAHVSLRRMIERHGADAGLREALLGRPGLPLDIRQAVAVALSQALSTFVVDCGWLSPQKSERVAREARERTAVALSVEARSAADVQRLVRHLRESRQLTPALILRAVLSHGMAFAEAAFAELTGLSVARVSGLLHDRRGAGFAALYRRAGLPDSLKPAFAAAFSALLETTSDTAVGASLSRRMVERVLSACAHLPADETGKLMTLLRRYEVEAAREEARELVVALAQEAAVEEAAAQQAAAQQAAWASVIEAISELMDAGFEDCRPESDGPRHGRLLDAA